MPQDLTLDVRRAVVAHLRGDMSLTALVPAVRIYGEFAGIDPVCPFIRIGLPLTGPFEATEWDGSELDFIIHIYAKGPSVDAISQIAKRVTASMEDFAPAGFSLADNAWRGTQYMADVVPENLHAVARFAIEAVAA